MIWQIHQPVHSNQSPATDLRYGQSLAGLLAQPAQRGLDKSQAHGSIKRLLVQANKVRWVLFMLPPIVNAAL